MEDLSITIKYDFESGLGPMEGERYIRTINVNICADDYEQTTKVIGKASFKIVYIDQAINAGYDFYEMFDSIDKYTIDFAVQLFDFEWNEVNEDILKYYKYDCHALNICMLDRIEILPEFRGHKIATKVIKDIVFHFSTTCGLFVLQVFPLQFEGHTGESDDWHKQLNLTLFESKEAVAFKRLSNYYRGIGFDKIPGYKNLLFYNPSRKNKKMDAIDLEE